MVEENSLPVLSPNRNTFEESSPLDSFSLSMKLAPPQSLQKLLDFKKNFKDNKSEIKEQFYQDAALAIGECNSSLINILGSYCITEFVSPPYSESQDYKNDTLLALFYFYSHSKLKYEPDIEARDLIYDRMNFAQFELFCHDFILVPRLLSKTDIKIIWKEITKSHIIMNESPIVISFTEFKDLLVRLALWCYYKPGLRKLILRVEGHYPKPEDIVIFFCTYLRLNDCRRTHNFLRKLNKNVISEHEQKNKQKFGMKTTHKGGKKIKKKLDIEIDPYEDTLIPMEVLDSKYKPSTTAAIAEAMRLPDKEEEELEKLKKKLAAKKATVSIGPKFDAYGEKIKPALFTDSARPSTVISDDKHSLPKPRKTKIPLKLSNNITKLANSTQNSGSRSIVIDDDDDDISEGVYSPINDMNHPDFSFDLPPKFGFFDRDSDEEDDLNSESSSTIEVYHQTPIKTLIEEYKKLYSPHLINLLDPYCYVPPKDIISDWVPTNGPLVDLGLVQPDVKIYIKFIVSNGTSEEVNIDVLTRDFNSDDCDLKTKSKPLVAGFSREIEVSFTPPNRVINNLCYVDVIIVSLKNNVHRQISCPVFYRVNPFDKRDTDLRGTAYSLPELINRNNTLLRSHEKIFSPDYTKKRTHMNTWSLTSSPLKTCSLKLLPVSSSFNLSTSLLSSNLNQARHSNNNNNFTSRQCTRNIQSR